MPESRQYRITPTPRPSGCDLSVEGYLSDVLTDLIGLLAGDGDLLERVITAAEGPAQHPDPFKPERTLPTEQLVADLSDLLPTAIRVQGPACDALAGALAGIVRAQGSRPVPQLRRGGAAA